MRKLMALAIVLVLAGTTRSWALFGLGEMKYDGSLEVNGDSANNETDFGNVVDPDGAGPATATSNDHRGNTATRVRLGVEMKVTEGVSGRLELVRSPRLYGSGPTTVTSEQALWTFQNAYAQLDNMWGMDIRLGRQYVGNPGDLVFHFGPKSDDSLTVTAIDGLLLECAKSAAKSGNFWDKLHLSLFTGKFTEDDTIANSDSDDTVAAGDVNLSDANLTISDVLPGGKINVGYLWGKDANGVSSKNDNTLNTLRVGVNGGVKENMLTYRAEFLQNSGEVEAPAAASTKYKGNALDLGLGYNAPENSIGGFGAWVNYVKASGDDDTTDTDDKSFHDFSALGVNTSDRYFGEIFGKSNTMGGGTPIGQGLNSGGAGQGGGLEVLNIGASIKPKIVEKTTFRLDYYMFSQPEDKPVTGVGGATTNFGDKFGNEWDLTANYAHSENVGITFGYAMLQPDDALLVAGGIIAAAPKTTQKDDAVTKLFARLNVKWGGEEK